MKVYMKKCAGHRLKEVLFINFIGLLTLEASVGSFQEQVSNIERNMRSQKAHLQALETDRNFLQKSNENHLDVEQSLISAGIHRLLGKKVVLNCKEGSSDWFLFADMRALTLTMQKYDSPYRSFTQFDERHWEICSAGTCGELNTYRFQYVLAPGFSEKLHSLACIEKEKGEVSLGLFAHDMNPPPLEEMEWLIFGSPKKGVLIRNIKYDLYLQGSSNNTISLTLCPLKTGLRWDVSQVDDCSTLIFALKVLNQDTSKIKDEYVDVQDYLEPSRKAQDNEENYLNINFSYNSLDLCSKYINSVYRPTIFAGFRGITKDDSSVVLWSASAQTVQSGAFIVTALPIKLKGDVYPPVGLSVVNSRSPSSQFWAVIPVTAGSSVYNLYLNDITNSSLPLTLSLRDNNVVLSPQDLYKGVEISDTMPLHVSLTTIQIDFSTFGKVINHAINPNDMNKPSMNLVTISDEFYNLISINEQKSIINASTVSDLVAMYKNSSTIKYGAALTIQSQAMRYNITNNYSTSTALPACALVWQSNGAGTSANPYILFVASGNSQDQYIVTGYNPVAIDPTIPVYQVTVSSQSKNIRIKDPVIPDFPVASDTIWWNPVFL